MSALEAWVSQQCADTAGQVQGGGLGCEGARLSSSPLHHVGLCSRSTHQLSIVPVCLECGKQWLVSCAM